MTLQTSCIIVNSTIGQWSGRKYDKDTTEQINAQAGAERGAIRANKQLVTSQQMAHVTNAQRAVRRNLEKYSMPWKDNSDRIMSREVYFEWLEKHSDLVEKFAAERDEFVRTTYPQIIDRAAFRMGAAYDPDDYPRPYEIEDKFYVKVHFDSVTLAGDFRLELEQEHLEDMRASIEADVEDRFKRVARDGMSRLAEALDRMATKLAVPIGDKGAVFRDSLVDSMDELIDMMPSINIVDDPDLESMSQRVRDTLYGLDKQALREDPEQRSAAQQEAEDILANLRGLMVAHG